MAQSAEAIISQMQDEVRARQNDEISELTTRHQTELASIAESATAVVEDRLRAQVTSAEQSVTDTEARLVERRQEAEAARQELDHYLASKAPVAAEETPEVAEEQPAQG